MTEFNVAGEGILDLECAAKILATFGATVRSSYDKRGKDKLDEKIPAYVSASRFGVPWLILRDFDQDHDCASELRTSIISEPPQDARFLLRFPVRSVESWLMADRTTISEFLAVSQNRLPQQPDQCENPKREIVQIAAHSRRRDVREALTPIDQFVNVGPEYNLRLTDYVRGSWRPRQAAENSPSLFRAITAVQAFLY